jgi:hypothetical protein
MRTLWRDDSGALIATEWVFVATILVLSLVVALHSVSLAVNSELIDFANAVSSLNQSYSFGGSAGCFDPAAGSVFTKTTKASLALFECQDTQPKAATGCP